METATKFELQRNGIFELEYPFSSLILIEFSFHLSHFHAFNTVYALFGHMSI